ncbi:hypothetical protein BAUCODRAFT_54873, partial [Baudoinia panamericana UAMH 10762]
KTRLVSDFGLQRRDLRKIDSTSDDLPDMFVRHCAIVANLSAVRAIIQADRVLLLVDNTSWHAGSAKSQYLLRLATQLQTAQSIDKSSPPVPYELFALEAILHKVLAQFEAEVQLQRAAVDEVLHTVQETSKAQIESFDFRSFAAKSQELAELSQRARLTADAIKEVLDHDEDLAAMYLTDAKAGRPHEVQDHESVELLLESYFQLFDDVVQRTARLAYVVSNNEATAKSLLDVRRNQIMLLDIRINLAMLALAAATLGAGLYGMNLQNGLEEWDWGFPVITSFCVGSSVLIYAVGRRRIQKLNLLRM